jgi:8-oxo-dGTP pyrophosphatase MutT (NUDIX family)
MPHDRDSWVELVRHALLPGPAVPIDQLLLVRDLAGTATRPLNPPEGVAPRRGAVLILLYPDGPELCFPLTVRSDRLPNHRGEISLPGGAVEASDADDAATALRECSEELGIAVTSVTILGMLSPIYIGPSNFRIVPVVGLAQSAPVFRPNGDEVSAVITVTLRELLDPSLIVSEQWTLRGREVIVPFYAVAEHKVWGATALVLSEFAARMRRVAHFAQS